MADLPASLAAFDASRAEDAVPLYLIPKEDADARIADVAPGAVQLAERMQFDGALGRLLPFEDGVLIGMGDGSDSFALGAAAARLNAGDYRLEDAPGGEDGTLLALGWALGAYRFSRYKTQGPVPTLILPEGADEPRLARDVGAVTLARDLVNTPTEDMGPAELAATAQSVAKAHGAEFSVVEGEALRKGFPLVHAVGRAAATPPRLIELRWGPADAPSVTLVGKGVCFDSGGLNIKGGKGMGLMKKDMGGSANALALAQMIMEAGLKVRLRLLIPAVENAISGNAFRPGDVFTARDGQTVEISNTDAEGRLILADALAYAAEEGPDRIISLATLTGAARVALGPDLPPVYSTEEGFAKKVHAAGDRLNDPVWPMPLWQRYHDYLSSPIADVNHAADTSFAGSITAALFLSRFVKDLPYTHLDIYAWVPSARPGRPVGGEAMAIRALFDALASEAG
ncbi:leucyl aminopeptidase family protein [Parvularcula oceani]|uniref:leucyl aminopeptidase family protein n=1 Tax=Parvularcula oceani TaxID=1247963 RepID=UPI0004E1A3B8|nr:leucyl aminopeptidase family protein [Parvularcula oceani]